MEWERGLGSRNIRQKLMQWAFFWDDIIYVYGSEGLKELRSLLSVKVYEQRPYLLHHSVHTLLFRTVSHHQQSQRSRTFLFGTAIRCISSTILSGESENRCRAEGMLGASSGGAPLLSICLADDPDDEAQV